jgi:hypothetical protein
MTLQQYLARGIAAEMMHPGARDQDPALVRSAEIALREERRGRRGRHAR